MILLISGMTRPEWTGPELIRTQLIQVQIESGSGSIILSLDPLTRPELARKRPTRSD